MRWLFIYICLIFIIMPMTLDAAPFECDGTESTRSEKYKNCYHFNFRDECFDEVDRMYGPYSPEGHRVVKERWELTVKRHGYGTMWQYRVGNSIRGKDVSCYTEDGINFTVTPEPAWIVEQKLQIN